MLLMRRFEEKSGQIYGQQKIRGFCHLYIGKEAVIPGTVSAIRKEDPIITAYRDHAHTLVKVVPPRDIMAELFATATGGSQGEGGFFPPYSKAPYFFAGHGIVSGQIPLLAVI